MNISIKKDELNKLFHEFEVKLNINDSIDVWKFHMSTYRHDYCSLAKKQAIYELKSQNLYNDSKDLHKDQLEVNFLTRNYIENGSYPIYNWKLERNVFDYKNEKSVFVRIDKPFITENDINQFLNIFIKHKYKAFLDKNRVQIALPIEELNISFDKFNNYIFN